jgi:hypothetical protein
MATGLQSTLGEQEARSIKAKRYPVKPGMTEEVKPGMTGFVKPGMTWVVMAGTDRPSISFLTISKGL